MFFLFTFSTEYPLVFPPFFDIYFLTFFYFYLFWFLSFQIFFVCNSFCSVNFSHTSLTTFFSYFSLQTLLLLFIFLGLTVFFFHYFNHSFKSYTYFFFMFLFLSASASHFLLPSASRSGFLSSRLNLSLFILFFHFHISHFSLRLKFVLFVYC